MTFRLSFDDLSVTFWLSFNHLSVTYWWFFNDFQWLFFCLWFKELSINTLCVIFSHSLEKISLEVKTVLENLSFFWENCSYSYIYVSVMLFNYTRMKMTHFSLTSQNLRSLGEVCDRLGTVWPWGISLAPSASQTKHTVQQGKLCWHCVLDCGLGPSLVARTITKNRQPGLTVLKQRAEQQQQQCKQNSPCKAV